MLWQITLVLLLGWFLALRWKTRKVRKVILQMKSDLSTLPLIGHAHHFGADSVARMAAFEKFSRQANKYDGWSPLLLGNYIYGMVSDAIDADYVMKGHLEKDDILKLTNNLLGNGLIFAPVSIWRPRRKVLATTFSQHNLNKFVNVFYKQSATLAENLSKEVNQGTFPAWKYFTGYTMDSICQTTLGSNIAVQKTNYDHKFLQSFQMYAELMSQRLVNPLLHNEFGFKCLKYFGMYQQLKECIDYIHGFVLSTIEKKRAALKQRQENPDTHKDDEQNGFKPIMELLIEASGGAKGYTNQELQEEAQVIFVAGTDTSAVGAAFVAMTLAKHPEIQDKVYKEIYTLYGDSNRPTKAEDLVHLTYLENVIKETLRLYPPVPITARKITKDDITPSGIKLPTGMGVIISHWGIHRNEKYWGPDVEKFRPERFVDSPPTHPGAYVPFGSGPRNCLGYKYAMLSMMTVTTTLLRKYRLLPPDNEDRDTPLRVKYEVMMKHADDFTLKVELRK